MPLLWALEVTRGKFAGRSSAWQSASFGSSKSLVRIQSPRPFHVSRSFAGLHVNGSGACDDAPRLGKLDLKDGNRSVCSHRDADLLTDLSRRRRMVNRLNILLISASFTSNVLAHELTGDPAGMHHGLA